MEENRVIILMIRGSNVDTEPLGLGGSRKFNRNRIISASHCSFTGIKVVENPETRNELVRQALSFSEKAIEGSSAADTGQPPGLYLDLAQEHFLLGDMEKAQDMLKRYLDATVDLGLNCQRCPSNLCPGCNPTRMQWLHGCTILL